MRKLPIRPYTAAAFLLCLLIVALLFGPGIFRRLNKVGVENLPGYTVVKQIRFSFTLQNETNRLIEKPEFLAYAPLKLTSTQRCDSVETSPPHELLTDDLGNRIMRFTPGALPPYGSKTISITARLSLSDTANQTAPVDLQPFLAPAPFIEAADSDLARFASTLKASNTVETARRMFDWVSRNVRQEGVLSKDRGALYAFKHRRGDCSESMYLFAAFSRANGIPARGMGGYVAVGETLIDPKAYHNWAEFFDGRAWRICDPQRKVFSRDGSQYIAMRVYGDAKNNHMGDHQRCRVTDGIKVRMD